MINLADLRRAEGGEEAAEELLRKALELDPLSAEAMHALGLCLVRDKQLTEALALLARAAELRPENSRFSYVFAVAVADAGDLGAAVTVLRAALERHPHDRPLLSALLGYARQLGRQDLAEAAAGRLSGRAP